MEPEPGAGGLSVLVCGTAFDPRTTTAVELRGVGEITAESLLGLSQLANVRTLLVSDSTFSDAGWAALMEVVRGLPVSELGVSGCALGPRHAADLADYVVSAGGSLTTLRCGSNPGMVGGLYSNGRLKTPDAHIEGFRRLCEALKPSQVTEVDFSGCGLGPLGAGCVADYVRNAIAVLNSMTLDKNPIFGELYASGGVKMVDKFVVEAQLLLDAVKSSSLTSLSLAGTGMGVKGATAVADAIRAMAALASMTISGVFTLVTTPYYYQLPISLDTFILVIQLA